jgi:hypothetical protein
MMHDSVFGELTKGEYGYSLNRQFSHLGDFLPKEEDDTETDDDARKNLADQLGLAAQDELLDKPLDEIDPAELPESVQNSSLGFLLKHGEAIHSAMEGMVDDDADEDEQSEIEEQLKLAVSGILPVSIETLGVDEPTDAQRAAYQFLNENEEAVSSSVIQGIFEYYQFARAEDPNWFDDWDCPAIDSVSDLAGLIEFAGVVVTPFDHNGSSLIGFQFQCDWDVEHGLGVLLDKDRVIDIGNGETAFEPTDNSTWQRIKPEITEEVTALIETIADAKDKAFDELPATEKLTHALVEANESEIERLLGEGANIDGADYPALFVAVDQPDIEMVKRILDLGGNASVKFEGQTARQHAAQTLDSVNQSKAFFVNLGEELIEEITPGATFFEEAEQYSDELEAIIQLLDSASV